MIPLHQQQQQQQQQQYHAFSELNQDVFPEYIPGLKEKLIINGLLKDRELNRMQL
jgi:hypothetical protein